jgi:hypothetical protein
VEWLGREKYQKRANARALFQDIQMVRPRYLAKGEGLMMAKMW